MKYREVIRVLHWEFWVDDDNPNRFVVYEVRDGDVIGFIEMTDGIPNNIKDLEQKLTGWLEQDVYEFVEENIEHC